MILLLFCSLSTLAQEQDFGLWSQFGVSYRFNKKSDISLSYRIDLKDNVRQFRRSNFNLNYGRKISKRLNWSLYYRFYSNYSSDVHRFRTSLAWKKKVLKKTRLQLRTLVQHDIEYFDRDWLQFYRPDYVWRNRILLEYNLPKKFEGFIYTEPFINLDYKGLEMYRLRSGIGVNRSKKRWKYGLEYFYQINTISRNELFVLQLGAEYDITRVIRPKKKKKKKVTEEYLNSEEF